MKGSIGPCHPQGLWANLHSRPLVIPGPQLSPWPLAALSRELALSGCRHQHSGLCSANCKDGQVLSRQTDVNRVVLGLGSLMS